jgi:hypothetical protein
VDTSILRAKMFPEPLHRLGLRACFFSGDASNFVLLALNQPICMFSYYVWLHPWILYFVSSVSIPCNINDPDPPLSQTRVIRSG